MNDVLAMSCVSLILIVGLGSPFGLYSLALYIKQTPLGRRMVAFILAIILLLTGYLLMATSDFRANSMGFFILLVSLRLFGVAFGIVEDNPMTSASEEMPAKDFLAALNKYKLLRAKVTDLWRVGDMEAIRKIAIDLGYPPPSDDFFEGFNETNLPLVAAEEPKIGQKALQRADTKPYWGFPPLRATLFIAVVLGFILAWLLSSGNTAGSVHRNGISLTFSDKWNELRFDAPICQQAHVECIAIAGLPQQVEFSILRLNPAPGAAALNATRESLNVAEELLSMPGAREVLSERLMIDNHGAVHKMFSLPAGNSTPALLIEIYLIQDGKELVLLRVQALAETFAEYQAAIDQTVASLRFTDE